MSKRDLSRIWFTGEREPNIRSHALVAAAAMSGDAVCFRIR